MKRLILLLLTGLALMAQAQTRWCVVDTEKPDVPLAIMSNVAYLMTSDWNDSLCVVCRDGSLHAGLKSISFKQFDVSAIGQPKAQQQPQVYSSPIGRQLTVSGCPANTRVHIYNMAGQEQKALTTTATEQTLIDVSDLPAGVYLLTVGTTTIKFLKR